MLDIHLEPDVEEEMDCECDWEPECHYDEEGDCCSIEDALHAYECRIYNDKVSGWR